MKTDPGARELSAVEVQESAAGFNYSINKKQPQALADAQMVGTEKWKKSFLRILFTHTRTGVSDGGLDIAAGGDAQACSIFCAEYYHFCFYLQATAEGHCIAGIFQDHDECSFQILPVGAHAVDDRLKLTRHIDSAQF